MKNKVKIEIVVNNSKNFIKDLISDRINLYDIKIDNDKIIILLDFDDYLSIKKKKTIKNIRVINYYGINKIKFLLVNNKLIITGLLIGIIINILLSSLILSIEIITPNKSLRKIIRKDLYDYGISKGKFKKSFHDVEMIKEKLMDKEKDKIEWLEITNTGTKYIVKVEERKQDNSINNCLSRNIISKKEAIIRKVESSIGEIKVSVNDYVNKGDVLISGFIYNKDEVVSKKCASGKVYGEVWYKVNVAFPKNDIRLVSSKDYSYGLTIHYYNGEITFPKYYDNYNKKEYNILGSNYLPLGLYLVKEYKQDRKVIRYSFNNIDKLAIDKSISELKKSFTNKPVVIKKKVLKKSIINSKIVVEVFIALEEDITDYQDISKIDIYEMNKKEE